MLSLDYELPVHAHEWMQELQVMDAMYIYIHAIMLMSMLYRIASYQVYSCIYQSTV